MDGELDGDEAAREITQLKGDAPACEIWETYHLIGDAMRDGASGTPIAPVLRSGFCARFGERLALEPTVLAPRATRFTRKVQTYALAAAASAAAFAVVGWMALSTPDTPGALGPDAPGNLAKSLVAPVSSPPIAIVKAPPAVSRPQLAQTTDAEHIHEYLLAHQGISPTTAIQGVTPYIRTVSNTGD
jgi:sigma-E factor negative regulatory protein RseA